MLLEDDPIRSALDFWCTYFLSRKSGCVLVYSTIAEKMIELLEHAFADSDNLSLESAKKWLYSFSREAEEIEIETRHEFNLVTLDLFRQNAHKMSESGKVILLNTINFFEHSL